MANYNVIEISSLDYKKDWWEKDRYTALYNKATKVEDGERKRNKQVESMIACKMKEGGLKSRLEALEELCKETRGTI